AAAAVSLATNDARACGACFHKVTESTMVTGHRMAFSISTAQTVLWDQIQYAGSPKEFAWVLPVKPGARVEVASDAWIEALDAATSAQVIAPDLNCPSSGLGGTSGGSSGCCGSSPPTVLEIGSGSGGDFVPPPDVIVVHEGSVGPYETVTLH